MDNKLKPVKTVLFYASVKDVNDFKYKFYKYAIETLELSNYNVITTNSFIDFLKFWRYSYSYIYFYKKGVIPAIISRALFKKVLFAGGCDDLHEESNPSLSSRTYFKFFAFIAILISNKCNVENSSDLKMLRSIAYFKNLKNKIFLHPLAIELPTITGIVKNKSTFLTICWMKTKENAKRKGLLKALQLFEELYNDNNQIQFYIIGDGSEVINWIENEIICNYNSRNNIHFLGLVDEEVRNKKLKDSMFYFQLSDFEGLGVAAIEATMFKSIVIHTNVGGLKDYMPDYSIVFKDLDTLKVEIKNMSDGYAFLTNKIDFTLSNLKKIFSHSSRSALIKDIYDY
jgi:glycosyltransferase involved in cell wall biosynthesis